MPKLKKKSGAQKQKQNRDEIRRKREDSNERRRQQASDTSARRSVRQDPVIREIEQASNTAARRSVRQNPKIRAIEQAIDTEARRSVRQDPAIRAIEQTSDTAARQSVRQDPVIRENEQASNTAARRSVRQNPNLRAIEQATDTAARRLVRQDPAIRAIEQTSDTAARQSVRQDPVIRETEQASNTAARRSFRQNPKIRVIEQTTDTAARQSVRQDPAIRAIEQTSDTAARRIARHDPVIRANEQDSNTIARRTVRQDSEKRKMEQLQQNKRRRSLMEKQTCTYDGLLQSFRNKIQASPTFICSCCGGLWYETSTSIVSADKLSSRNCSQELIQTVLCVNQAIHRFCSTCKSAVYKQRIPKLCLNNGFDFPTVPNELQDLSPLEERLVALRIPFMQIRLLGAERQSALRGNVVNVEVDLNVCAAVLPRKFDETSTIQVQLMRRMRYQSPYMHEIIRPLKVYTAAKYLINTELYKCENVILSEEWSRCLEGDTMNFICSDPNSNLSQNVNMDEHQEDELTQMMDEMDLSETQYQHGGVEESLIFSEKETASNYFGVRIAPAEGNTPIPLHRDTNSEVSSFPTIYCGVPRQFKEGLKVTYTDIAKSELRRYDRRACLPTKLLYAFKKSFNEKVVQAIQICLRKTSKTESLTAGSALKVASIRNLLDCDDGYAVFKHLRSSPSYWKEKTKTVLAMIRQLGKPAFFITFSAAETKWTELLIMLHKILKKTDITEDGIKKLTFQEIAELIRSDPVTCMRHFEHRLRALQNLLMKPGAAVFSPYELEDFFTRLEFAMRGSPHDHGLYWLKNAPVFIEGDDAAIRSCIEFIDLYITCERSEDQEMEKVIAYQIHKHSQTCTKRSKKCRFGFPRPPLDETQILTPLPNDFDLQLKSRAQELYIKIQNTLEGFGRAFKEDIDFETFLDSLDTSYWQYIFALRSSIKRSTVFLKRSTNSIFVNNYNRKLLLAWEANMDIQFVIDTYACAKYCVGYILKGEGGVSRLLQALSQDIKRGNTSVRDQVKTFASILINGSEISAQEAAAFLLGIPNTHSTRQDIFINTAPPEQRISILKSNEDLQNLSVDSQDVCVKGLIDHYVVRPEELEDICLAEFASMYEFSKVSPSTVQEEDSDKEPKTPVTKRKKKQTLHLLDNSGLLRLRQVRKVIRFRHYGKHEDPTNYCREKLMLYLPWRDEEEELLSVDVVEKMNQYHETVFENSKPFIFNRDIDDDILGELFNDANTEDYDVDTGPLLDEDLETLTEQQETFDDFDDDIAVRTSRVEKFLPPRLVEENQYLQLMRSLNDKQRRFVLHNLHLLKNPTTPLYSFLSGGAGVGKSHVITATVQSYMRFCSKKPTTSPEQICVLVSAPTGKAAFNVFGMTLHCTFKLPPTQYGGKLCELDQGAVNSLRIKLENTQLFIIDEISMVSVKQLYDIDQRLRQIFCTAEDFGGKSVLVVGHLRQLPPIGGSYVFKEPHHLPLGSIVGNHLWGKFGLFELDEIMRQRGELMFCKALNNMAEGVMDAEDVALIRSREVNADNDPPFEAIRLFQTNEECRIYNIEVHSALDTEGVVSTAYDIIQGTGTAEEKQKLKDYAKTLDRQKTDGIPYQTSLKVGAEYFVSTNIDVSDGLFNGSTGALKKIDFGTTAANVHLPIRAWLDFRNPLIGFQKKSITRNFQSSADVTFEWVPIDRITRNLSKTQRHGRLEIIRKQIPLIPANGITIAKSQGSTLTAVVLHVKRYYGNNPPSGTKKIRERKLTRENLYVACSRSSSLSGLFIHGEFEPPEKPGPEDPVTIEMTRLRGLPYTFSIKFLQDYDDGFEKLYFHNVQSLLAHHEDVTADQCCIASDILAFVEPHLLQSDTIDIPNFTSIHRSNCRQGRNSEGALLLSKKDGRISDVTPSKHFSDVGHCLFVKFTVSEVNVVMMYKSPKYPDSTFIQHLSQIIAGLSGKMLVFGDININLRTHNGNAFREMLASFGLVSMLDSNLPSTDGGSQIDCCFANLVNMDAWYYESYFSYHKPICMVWPKP